MATPADIPIPKALKQARRLARITDFAIKIPFTGIRLGMDSLIGILPVAGDIVMLGVSLWIIHLARQMGAPSVLQRKMLRNCAIDFLGGALPAIGDIFDIFFKANLRNVKLLEDWWQETQSRVQR